MDAHGTPGSDQMAGRDLDRPLVERSIDPDRPDPVQEARQLREENARLQQELAELRRRADRLERIHAEMVTLLNAKNPDKLVHDLRNVLNELVLLNAIVNRSQK